VRRRPRVVLLCSYGLFGGDIQTLLVAWRSMDPEEFDLFAVCKPRGEVFQLLKQIPQLHLIPMEMGNGELALPNRSSRLVRAGDFIWAALRIMAFVKRNQIDAICSIDRSVDPLLGALVSRFTGCAFVLGAAFPYYPQSSTVHHFLDKVKRYANSANQFQVIPYALEIEDYDFSLRGSSTRCRFGIDPGTPVVVMMGRLTQFKGQDVLVRAAALVLRECPQAQFLIAGRPAWGDGENYEQSLTALIAELGLGQNVRLVGFIDHNEIPDFIATSSLVVMPSIEEPFGFVALEGMAMARPVVATRAGGVPEFVSDGKVGLLIPPRDHEALAKAILYLLRNPELAADMGRAARRHVEQYHSTKHYANQVGKLINSAIQAKQGGA
jgi:glycosyltransferase involved in cell wall biosynthesis